MEEDNKTNGERPNAPTAEQMAAQLAQAPQSYDSSYKPSSKEVQTALKNAGLYMGEIDGKIGPKTERAIEYFQAQNNLIVDGKVGPKTWSKLHAYLSQSPAQSAQAEDAAGD